MNKQLFIDIKTWSTGDYIVDLTTIKLIINNECKNFDNIIVRDFYYDTINQIFDVCELKDSCSYQSFEFPVEGPTDRISISYANAKGSSLHLIDMAYSTFIRDHNSVPIEYKNYVKYIPTPVGNFGLPDKYVVIQTTYRDIKKSISPDNLKAIIEHLHNIGYMPVLVGNNKFSLRNDHNMSYENTSVDVTDKCIDLINKTSLKELLWIIHNSKLVIGADGGILHLAGMTDVPILGQYTITHPLLVMPIRNNVVGYKCESVVPDLRCTGCLHTDSICGDLKCVTNVKPDDFINKIDALLTLS